MPTIDLQVEEEEEAKLEKSLYACLKNEDSFMQYKRRSLFPTGKVKAEVQMPSVVYNERGHAVAQQ